MISIPIFIPLLNIDKLEENSMEKFLIFLDTSLSLYRILKYLCLKKEKNEACMQVLAEMSDDPDMPRNFNCAVTLLTDWDYANGFLQRKTTKITCFG